MTKQILFIFLCTAYTIISTDYAKADEHDAKNIFARYQNSVYQIRVIDISTDNKTGIGSGFLIDQQGFIATNYHVVAQKILHPTRYKLEYISRDGVRGDLELLNVDIIHDLAIVKGNVGQHKTLQLSQRQLSKGTRVYSLGNPHDLGMSIIEGTYNGLLERSLYDKIFFTGSINPGMSGGPALDDDGFVVGINVSTAGNQLSFLIPASYLEKLLFDTKTPTTANLAIHEIISQQLYQHQESYIGKIIVDKWLHKPFGNAQLPDKISAAFNCWGDTDEDEKALIQHTYSHCSIEDTTYISTYFTTGGITYTYDFYTNKDLSISHFYNIYNMHFGDSVKVNTVSKEDVTNYNCHTDFVMLANKDWKLAFCARNYRQFQQLYDISVELALVSESDTGLIISIAVAGISKPLALHFVQRFLGEIRWLK